MGKSGKNKLEAYGFFSENKYIEKSAHRNCELRKL